MTIKPPFFLLLLFCFLPLTAFSDDNQITDVYQLGYESKAPPNNKISVKEYDEERRTLF